MELHIKISSGSIELLARLEKDIAPKSCEWFLHQLPFQAEFIQAAWSGEAFFTDLKKMALEVPFEQPTSYPVPGQILLYPGSHIGNVGEIYIPYGGNCFACPTGQIAGNPFLTIIEGKEQLKKLGEKIRNEGAQTIHFAKEDL